MKTLSRRTALRGGAAVAVAAAVPVPFISADNEATHFLRLWQELDRLRYKYGEDKKATGEARAGMWAEYMSEDARILKEHELKHGLKFSETRVILMYPEDEAVLKARHGVPALEAAQQESWGTCQRQINLILDMPATTPTGLAVKMWKAWENFACYRDEAPDYDSASLGEQTIWRVLDSLEAQGAPARPWLYRRQGGAS